MDDRTTAEAPASANEEPRLPGGEYAIVEQLGHRTLIGRVSEVEKFGTKLLQIEPLFGGELLPAVLIGGATIYCFTPCTAAIAAARQPTRRYQLPACVLALMPHEALPAPFASADDDAGEPEFAPAFLTADLAGDHG